MIICKSLIKLGNEARRLLLESKRYFFNSSFSLIGKFVYMIGLLTTILRQTNNINQELLVKIIFWYLVTSCSSDAVFKLEYEIRKKNLDNILLSNTSLIEIQSLKLIIYLVKNLLLIILFLGISLYLLGMKINFSVDVGIITIILPYMFFIILTYFIFTFLVIINGRITAMMALFSNYFLFFGNVITDKGFLNKVSFNYFLFSNQKTMYLSILAFLVMLNMFLYVLVKKEIKH